jgi:D-Tyr-tRNAtyr deacylase
MKNHRVAVGFVLLLGALGGTLDGSLALIAIDRLAQSEEYTDEMDKIETYRGFEIRAFESEEGRWRAEIRKADGSMLKVLVGDSGHRTSITTSADTLTAETSIDEVKKAIDAGGLS